jgi:carbon starvation protein CstA
MLRKKKAWFTLIPAVFVLVTTLASLFILFGPYVRQKNMFWRRPTLFFSLWRSVS